MDKKALIIFSFLPVIIGVFYFLFATVTPSYWHFGDYAHHIANTYLFYKYGFHGIAPNVNYGYNNVMFLFYPPLHAFITSAFFSILYNGNTLYALKLSNLIMIIISMLIGFLSVFLNRGVFGNTKKALIFYLFSLFNFISLGIFLKIGRVTEF